MSDYHQCELRNGEVKGIAWIPSKFAIIGRVLKIKVKGKWQEDWTVVNVFYPAAEKEQVEIRSRDYRNMATFGLENA